MALRGELKEKWMKSYGKTEEMVRENDIERK